MQGVSFTKLREQGVLQKERYFLWVPVFFGAGIGTYFSLPFEPSFFWGMVPWIIFSPIFFYRDHTKPLYLAGLIVFLVISGFFSAQIRTYSVQTPILEKKIGPVQVTGIVETVEPMEEGAESRIILSGLTIENILLDKTPRKIRLRLRNAEGIYIGQKIRVLALLNPPSGPVVPGGFDFRRHLYFMGIGAVGVILKPPEILEQPQSFFMQGIEGLRQNIGSRIREALPAREASVALALMIGQQNALNENDMAAIRNAGLAHMLSISGLHISLVAGVLFFLSRLMMAAIPDFALKHPIKKYAAVLAMLGAIFYMLLAGSTAPTLRSVLMTGTIFLAIILDRSPISLRLVAFAALIVLILAPENLVSVSFQMSFAAVAALIAFFEATREFWAKWNREGNATQKALFYLASVCMTTIIATVVTTPFSIYHFQQFAFLGVVANFVAVPLLSFLVMPFIVLSFFLMPLGLESLPLWIVGWGVDIILRISYTASSLPHAVMLFPAWPFASFILCVIAGLWIIVWKGWGKALAIFPLLLSGILIAQNRLPDIVISESHKLFGFRIDDELYVSTRSTDKFTLENWERFYGIKQGSAIVLPKGGLHEPFHCDPAGCRFEINTHKVAYITDPYETKRDCVWAKILLSTDPVDNKLCRTPIVVDKFDTWRGGSYALWIRKNNIIVKSATDMTGNRPWVKKAYSRQE